MSLLQESQGDRGSRHPLPLAQLHRRTLNAKSSLERHQAVFYLWECAIKLLGSVTVIEYLKAPDRDPDLDEKIKNLVRPSLGHWWEYIRLFVPLLAGTGDPGFQEVGTFLESRTRHDMPRCAGLDSALRETLGTGGEARTTVRIPDLFDRLIHYRNRELGHGAVGQRPSSHYDRMSRAMLAAAGEILQQADFLAGRKLIFIEDVRRRATGEWLIERFELHGELPRRLESLVVPESSSISLPLPDQVHLECRRLENPDGEIPADYLETLHSLYPLLLFNPETAEVSFLNSRRGKRSAEYLCYHSGRIVNQAAEAGGTRNLLEKLIGSPVQDIEIDRLLTQGQEPEVSGRDTGDQTAGRWVGDFELISKIGRGGMGIVYRAWQPSLARQVALKCLLRVGDDRAEARFAREIQSLGRVDHPNLVKIYSSGSDGDQWYYAMELVEGADLGTICEQLADTEASRVSEVRWMRALSTACERAKDKEESILAGDEGEQPGPLSSDIVTPMTSAPDGSTVVPRADQGLISRGAEIIRQTAEAAHSLHEAGIIHRDIKPGNIMLTKDGKSAVLMDLGLVQLVDEEEGRLTCSRQFVGTFRYASPEQLVMCDPLDRRSDIYSLGVTLWELFTLRPLYGSPDRTSTPELLRRIQFMEPEQPRRFNPQIPKDLETIVLKCLEKNPDRRYRTASDLALDLQRWQRGEPVSARPPTLGYVAGKFVRRHRGKLSVAVALLLSALVATAVGMFQIIQSRRAAESALVAEMKARRNLEDSNHAQVRLRQARVNLEKDPGLALLLALDGKVQKASRSGGGPATIFSALENLRETRTLVGHGNAVRIAVFNDEETRIFTASDDGTASIWNGNTGQELEPVIALHGPVLAACFRGETIRFAEASEDSRSIRVLDWIPGEGRRELSLLEGHAGPIHAASFDPAGIRVVTASADRSARVWVVKDGDCTSTLTGHGKGVSAVSFSQDGNRVATGTTGGQVRIWNVGIGFPDCISTIPAHAARIDSTAFCRDGKRLATASRDGTARIWNLENRSCSGLFDGHEGEVFAVAFNPEGTLIVTGSADGTARLWNPQTGKLQAYFKGHSQAVHACKFSPSGRYVITSSADGTARLWHAYSYEDRTTCTGHTRGLLGARFSPDGKWAVTCSHDRTARVWNTDSRKCLATLDGHTGSVTAAMFSDDSSLLITCSHNGSTRIWKAGTWEATRNLYGSMEHVFDTAFSPDHRLAATASADRAIRIWRTSNGQCLTTLQGHLDWVTSVSFNTDGSRILSASQDGTARIWNVDGTGEPTVLEGHEGRINSACYGPDGRLVLSGSIDMTGRIWNAGTGVCLCTLTGHSKSILDVSFNTDGRRVVTASRDRTAVLWDVQNGRAITTLVGHGGPVQCARFSPDGRLVATASDDGTARLWDVTAEQTVLTMRGHSRGVKTVEFSPDGLWVITASEDGTARFWSVNPEAEARRLKPRDWRFDERERFNVWTVSTRRAREEATTLVDDLFSRLIREEDVILRLRCKENLRQDVRRAALWLARKRGELAIWQCYRDAWNVVKRPGAGIEARRIALKKTEAAVEQLRKDERCSPLSLSRYLNVLGAAQYRMEKYKKAGETLKESWKIDNRSASRCIALAFLAMATKKQTTGLDDDAAWQLYRQLQNMIRENPGMEETLGSLVQEVESTLEE